MKLIIGLLLSCIVGQLHSMQYAKRLTAQLVTKRTFASVQDLCVYIPHYKSQVIGDTQAYNTASGKKLFLCPKAYVDMPGADYWRSEEGIVRENRVRELLGAMLHKLNGAHEVDSKLNEHLLIGLKQSLPANLVIPAAVNVDIGFSEEDNSSYSGRGSVRKVKKDEVIDGIVISSNFGIEAETSDNTVLNILPRLSLSVMGTREHEYGDFECQLGALRHDLIDNQYANVNAATAFKKVLATKSLESLADPVTYKKIDDILQDQAGVDRATASVLCAKFGPKEARKILDEIASEFNQCTEFVKRSIKQAYGENTSFTCELGEGRKPYGMYLDDDRGNLETSKYYKDLAGFELVYRTRNICHGHRNLRYGMVSAIEKLLKTYGANIPVHVLIDCCKKWGVTINVKEEDRSITVIED